MALALYSAGAAADAGASDAGPPKGADAAIDAGALGSAPAHPGGGTPSDPSDAGAVDLTVDPIGSCIERIPEGKARPPMKQRVEPRGLAGYAVTLEVVIEHGKAERVFPNGFRFDLSSEELAAFERTGFALPHVDGGAGPELSREELPDGARTTVRLSFVALPTKGGRQSLVLGSVPITIARASGELMTLCTKPAALVVDPPIANTPEPVPRPNPPPRPQREVWEEAKLAALVGAIALVTGALLFALITWLRRRPKPAPPPPPPRPPWEVAMEALHDLRSRDLVAQERLDEHFDEVCLILRRYLGDRYGIGGELGDAGALESTTEEILRVLARIVPPIPVMPQVEHFLRETDLVKFAKVTPDAAACEEALHAVERIVTLTVPPRPAATPNKARAT
ncbi:MAG: hypothetical protein KIT72_01715 [Polyangiaceae bacterium]|nr:hypothetical protein [Polyangiaceae bacterium]MCW5789115.1 hypothetical protein [Polyangiaceae bacterium]